MTYGGGNKNVTKYRCDYCKQWYDALQSVYSYENDRIVWFCSKECKQKYFEGGK